MVFLSAIGSRIFRYIDYILLSFLFASIAVSEFLFSFYTFLCLFLGTNGVFCYGHLVPTSKEDIDECSLKTDNCHSNALCINTSPGFKCVCKDGFVGDGVFCTNVDDDVGKC